VRRMEFRPPRAAQALLLEAGPPRGVCITVEGPIGVGKTTLTRLLAARLEAVEMLEVVEENPFLHHFYQDIRAYAFQTQIFFFLSRYRQQGAVREQRESGRSVVSDYMFAKDRLFARMNLSEHEWDLYERLFALARTKLEPGGLVVADNVLSHADTLEAYSAARQADPTLSSVTVPLDRGLELTVVLTEAL